MVQASPAAYASTGKFLSQLSLLSVTRTGGVRRLRQQAPSLPLRFSDAPPAGLGFGSARQSTMIAAAVAHGPAHAGLAGACLGSASHRAPGRTGAFIVYDWRLSHEAPEDIRYKGGGDLSLASPWTLTHTNTHSLNARLAATPADTAHPLSGLEGPH
jgi:hypothetical protein